VKSSSDTLVDRKELLDVMSPVQRSLEPNRFLPAYKYVSYDGMEAVGLRWRCWRSAWC
jgi:hypothetical protein